MNQNVNYLAPMFLQARGFKKVFDNLHQQYIDIFINNNRFISNDTDLISVTATNGAFACELYLKCLFVYEHRNDKSNISHSHKIYSLFNNISKNRRKEITQFIKNKYFWEEEFLLDNIRLSNNDYTDFRYLFEQKNSITLRLNFFNVFLDALDSITLKVINSFDFPNDINEKENSITITKKFL